MLLNIYSKGGPKLHIPDGFLDLKTSITTYLISGVSISMALKQLNKNFEEKNIPTLGLLGAFIFAAQMINLPIAGGTSGHLMGGVLAMLIAGPWAAVVVISTILFIQAIIFMDGGIIVLGANILNMAVVQVFLGYFIFYKSKRIVSSYKIRTFLAAFLSMEISAALVALELAFSQTITLSKVLPAMLGWHFLIGILEGIITLIIIIYLKKVAPDRVKI